MNRDTALADNDHFVFKTFKRNDGTKGVRALTPAKVLKVENVQELEAQLTHYAKLLFQHTTPDKQIARRKYVEEIRPALRYYCKKFGRSVPNWLAEDSFYTEMSDAEKAKHFGPKPLRIGEFKKAKPIPGGSIGDEEPQQ